MGNCNNITSFEEQKKYAKKYKSSIESIYFQPITEQRDHLVASYTHDKLR